jgi:hypothetical protein
MEKQIIITLNEDGSLNIAYPNYISYMETIGILESSKAILLNGYVNPKVGVNENEGNN